MGVRIKESGLFKAGKVLPPDIVQGILREAIHQVTQASGPNLRLMIDGVARTVVATDFLLKELHVGCCIQLQISEQDIIDRVAGRRIHKRSGRTYHVIHNPPQMPGLDDITGERLKKRSNDTPEGIHKRMIMNLAEAEAVLVSAQPL